jgi:branched-chain amino acid transport system permease protein
VNFFIGESQREETSGVERVAQRIADGVRLGLIIAMCSVGLSLIFGTTGLTNFAHGEMVTFGALVAYFLNSRGMHIVVAAPIAVAAGGLLGLTADRFGFSRFRARGVGLISQMVITLGLSIAAKNFFLWRFGGRDKPYLDYTNQVGVKIGPIVITPRDLIVTVLALVVLVGVALTLQYTRLGKATRAVSDNADLASSTGIDSAKIIRIIWITAGALAALGGVFRGLDEQVAWDMGTSLLFLMFAGITLGGLGSAYGALVGGFVVGLLVETSTLLGVPTELKVVPALLILILILLVRPQGILGRSQRVG